MPDRIDIRASVAQRQLTGQRSPARTGPRSGLAARVCALALWGLCTLVARPAQAQLQFAGDAPRIYTIEPRDHLFRHEITLGAGVLPLDAFYLGAIAQGSYINHFNDKWGWEVFNGFYAFDFDTSLKSFLKDNQVLPDKVANYRIRSILATNVMFKPLYGKLAVFNQGIVRSETYLSAGLGVAVGNQDTGYAPNIGVGFNFWVSHALALHFEVRDHFVFSDSHKGSVLQILLGGSFNFNIAQAAAMEYDEGSD